MECTRGSRIVQIHPTRRCNLRCLHCYSTSGPEERGQLSAALLRGLLTDAAAEGYTVASFSGGEPLLYQPLRELLLHAHRLGLVTTVTTNGMLLDEKRLDELSGAADLVAISLDGEPASHDRMRADPRAFSTMAGRLPALRDSGIPFGFIFTLTQYNLHELEWVAGFALAQGARLLQIHPLEAEGRAANHLPGEAPDGIEGAYAFLLASRLQDTVGDRMRVQLDLVSRLGMAAQPGLFHADGADTESENRTEPGTGPLAERLATLVIEPDGTVAPMEHGFSRALTLGNLHRAPLHELAPRWLRDTYPAFRNVCRRAFKTATADPQVPIVDWSEAVRTVALAG